MGTRSVLPRPLSPTTGSRSRDHCLGWPRGLAARSDGRYRARLPRRENLQLAGRALRDRRRSH